MIAALIHGFLTPRGFGVRLAKAFVFLSAGWFFWSGVQGRWGLVALFIGYIVLCAFTWVRWYDRRLSRRGIEDHFDKASVLALWPAVLVSLVYWLSEAGWPAYLVLPLLVFLLTVNAILVSFHWRDRDPMIPNELSGHSRVF